jgi:hypothetical protein
MTLTARVIFRPAYFNRAALARIPARWTAEIVDGLPDGTAIYSDGLSTSAAAVDDLLAQLKARGLSGTLRLAR